MEDLIAARCLPCGLESGVDEAIRLRKPLGRSLPHGKEEATTLGQVYLNLKEILGTAETE